MRMLLKPEISSWRLLGVGGRGVAGDFWLPPLIVLIALFIFYLEGRGRLRPLYHILLIGWHLTITGIFLYGSLRPNSIVSFRTWGIEFSFIWLVIPLAAFSILAIVLTHQEMRGHYPVPVFGWSRINWKTLGVAVLLLPIALIFFRMGTGFDLMVKIAVALTILQWILLTEALGRPHPAESE